MTRKDYVKIADAIKTLAEPAFMMDRRDLWLVADKLANIMKQDNPRFDRRRFMKAAGLDDIISVSTWTM
jgi:hypothetical protein